MNYQFIKMIVAYQKGDELSHDFVFLKNGKVLAIDSRTIELYNDLDEFHGGKNGQPTPSIEWQ